MESKAGIPKRVPDQDNMREVKGVQLEDWGIPFRSEEPTVVDRQCELMPESRHCKDMTVWCGIGTLSAR